MSDSVGSGSRSNASVTAAAIVAAPGPGGLIDVSGITFDQLSAVIGSQNLGRALDCILASGQNGSGYHGFSNYIGSAR